MTEQARSVAEDRVGLPALLHREFFETLAVLVFSSAIFSFILVSAFYSDRLDFNIYYGAAGRVLNGLSPYARYGPHELSYVYLPWVAWLFIPLAQLPIDSAWGLFVALNLFLLGVSNYLLLRAYRIDVKPRQVVLLFALALLMDGLLFRVGQVGLVQFIGVVMALVFVQTGRPTLAGLTVPLIAIKPQLVLLYVPALWWRGGRKTVLASFGAGAVLIGLATLVTPNWWSEMIRTTVEGQLPDSVLVWKFATLASWLGLPRAWNYIFALAFVPLAALIAFRTRQLAANAWLTLVLALSLASTPYVLAYDLALLIPAMVWLAERRSAQTTVLWLTASFASFASSYSSGAYAVILLVVTAALMRARRVLLERAPHPRNFDPSVYGRRSNP